MFNFLKKKEPKTFKFKNGLYRFKKDITLIRNGIMIGIQTGSEFRIKQFEPATPSDVLLYELSIASVSPKMNVSFLLAEQTLIDSVEYIEPDVKLNCD